MNTKALLGAGLLIVVVGLGVRLALPALMPEPARAVDATQSSDVTYLCLETGERSTGPWQPTPAENPKTGRKTLRLAFYCPDCEKWYPGPVQGPRETPAWPVCPRHRQPLATEPPNVDPL